MNLDAKVNALIAKESVPGADSAPDKDAGAPPTGTASGAESAAGAAGEGADSGNAAGSPASPASSPAAPTMADLYAEKLAKVREQRRDQKLKGRARETFSEAERIKAEAQAEREAAAKERAELAEGRKDFRKFFAANNMNAREAYEAMTREAIEADTPAAQLKAMQEAWKAELAQSVEPLRKTIEDLQREKAEREAGDAESAFARDFNGTVKDASYLELRVEYPDDRLIQHAKNFRDNPAFFHQMAQQHKVRLTSSDGRFTMQDILNVLKSVQDAHRAGTESRRAALAPPPSDAAPNAAAANPTVNGTAERRNAGATTLGNDLVTARAADGKFLPTGKTAAERTRERVRRFGG